MLTGMNIRKAFLFYIFFFCLSLLSPSAQAKQESGDKEDREFRKSDIGFYIESYIPMNKDIRNGTAVGLTYSNCSNRGLGFRTGFQYTSRIGNIGNIFSIPVAVFFRTSEATFEETFRNSAKTAANSMAKEKRDYNRDVSGREFFAEAIIVFLASFFRNAEFYAGISPGYIAGNSRDNVRYSVSGTNDGQKYYWSTNWLELKNRFTLPLDLGMNLNCRIWRFELKVMPAFHFNVTNNYVNHISQGDSAGETYHSTQQIRWFFSIAGGLTFRF